MIVDVELLHEWKTPISHNDELSQDDIKNKKKIYLVFTDTGSTVATIIKRFTNSPYNHVAISFEDDMKSDNFIMYSYNFSLKTDGFVRDRITDYPGVTTYSMYSILVEPDVYRKIKLHVQYMDTHISDYRYSILGLFALVFSIPYEKKGSYFCSQFVITLFNKAGMPLFGKPASLISPYDIMKHPDFEFVKRGKLHSAIKK